MAETIETEAKQALAEIGRRTAMAEAANDMSASAARTGASAGSAAGAAAQALANAQTVASAAEQLTASIREIGGQVSQSSAVVGRAVEAGRATRETIGALNEQVGTDRHCCRHDQRDRGPDQSAGAECHHRGGAGR